MLTFNMCINATRSVHWETGQADVAIHCHAYSGDQPPRDTLFPRKIPSGEHLDSSASSYLSHNANGRNYQMFRDVQ